MLRTLGNVLCDIDYKIMGTCQIMYFLVKASPPIPLDVATSNFAGTFDGLLAIDCILVCFWFNHCSKISV